MRPLREQHAAREPDEARAASMLGAVSPSETPRGMKSRVWREVESAEIATVPWQRRFAPALAVAILFVATAIAGATVGRNWLRGWTVATEPHGALSPERELPAERGGAIPSPREQAPEPRNPTPAQPGSSSKPEDPIPAPRRSPQPPGHIPASEKVVVDPRAVLSAPELAPREPGAASPVAGTATLRREVPRQGPPQVAPPSEPVIPAGRPTVSGPDVAAPPARVPFPADTSAAHGARMPLDEDDEAGDVPIGPPVMRGPATGVQPAENLLYEAVRALRHDHDPARARDLLEKHRAEQPNVLAEEALSTEIEAAAVMGDRRAAELAASYIRRYPHGRFLRSARDALRRFAPSKSEGKSR
jgi:hypothetical protein